MIRIATMKRELDRYMMRVSRLIQGMPRKISTRGCTRQSCFTSSERIVSAMIARNM